MEHTLSDLEAKLTELDRCGRQVGGLLIPAGNSQEFRRMEMLTRECIMIVEYLRSIEPPVWLIYLFAQVIDFIS